MTVFGNLTHNYFVYGPTGQWHLAGQTVMPHISAIAQTSSHYNQPASGANATRRHAVTDTGQQEPLVRRADLQPRVAPSQLTRTSAVRSQMEHNPGATASRGRYVTTATNEKTVLVIADESLSTDLGFLIPTLRDRCRIVHVCRAEDAIDHLESGGNVAAVFVADLRPDRFFGQARDTTFCKTLLAYTKSGGTTIITPYSYRSLTGEFFNAAYVKNHAYHKQLPEHLAERGVPLGSLLKNGASHDLLYIHPKDIEASRESPTKQYRGPFALTKLEKGSVGWFGGNWAEKELAPVLLFMLGLTDEDD
ncbi:hypothetical protein PMZ80_001573 [Knufia obscura]|uniref:Response regulatory domain-containing protein n=1 Tax=Knufia obscura TaxID=1635080 RepID=A0ABR0S4J5_9EURO|nr:hypothetical protein PMZ80_001573 [Knufia obscura]